MAGLQEVAAIIGVAEVGFRSICTLYDFFRDLENVPKEIEAIKRETLAVQRCLSELSFLQQADDEIKAAVQRTGLPQVVTDCGEACLRLRDYLLKWRELSGYTLRSRISFRWDKKAIDNVISEIGNVKQTVLLTLAVTQFSMQQSNSKRAVATKQREVVQSGPLVLPKVTAEQNQAVIPRPPTMPNYADNYYESQHTSYSGQQSSHAGQQAYDASQTTSQSAGAGRMSNVCQTFRAEVNVKGEENQIGMRGEFCEKVYSVQQNFNGKVCTSDKSKRNKIGIF